MKKTYDEFIVNAAKECAANLKPEEIEYIKTNISYSSHHFLYGMAIRNKYADKIGHLLYEELDDLSRDIFICMLTELFPELGDDYEKISELTDNMFYNEINTHYYIHFGKLAAEDFPVENYHLFETDDDIEQVKKDLDIEKIEQWHQKQIRHLEDYIFPIAERIWNIDTFFGQAQADGISRKIIESTYSLCVDVFKKHHIFIPAEIVYFSSKKTVPPHISDVVVKHLTYFAQMHPAKIRVLPDYVLKGREFIKEIIKNKGSLLGLLPEYKNDFEIVKLAVKNYAVAIQFAGQKLKDNSDIVKTAVSNSFDGNIFSLKCMKKYRDNDKIIKMALKVNGSNIRYASKRIRSDFDMAKYALMHTKQEIGDQTFGYLSAALRNNKQLAMIELKHIDPAIEHFSKRLQNDDEIAEYIYRRKRIRWGMNYMSKRLQKKYKWIN